MVSYYVESDLDKCRLLWERFSSIDCVFDLFDYRLSIYDPARFRMHFIVADSDGAAVAVLPLWYSIDDDCYEFFGSYFIERNKFLATDRSLIPHLVSQVPERTCISYVEKSESDQPFLCLTETRYFIELADFGHSIERYLSSFSGKHRKNLRHDLQRLSALGPTVHFNRLDDYDRMAELNIERFSDESFFKEPFFYYGFRRFLELAKKRGELRMISIDVSGVTQSVEVAVQFNGEYSVLMGGTNIAVSNVGKLMVLEHIKHAIANKAGIIDFLATDSGWKKLWNMKEEPVYYFANYDVEAEEAGKNRRY